MNSEITRAEVESAPDNTPASESFSRRIWSALSVGSATVGAAAGAIFVEQLLLDSVEYNNPAQPINLTEKLAVVTFVAGVAMSYFSADKASPQSGDVPS
jgi:hypothetical protein